MTRWTSRRLVPARRTVLASGSSHGVPFKDRPSIDITACVHSRRTGARGCHLSSAFRPCRFARLRRFAPQPTLQVCCALLPTMGFTWFRADRRRSCRAARLPKKLCCGLPRCIRRCAATGCVTPRPKPWCDEPPFVRPSSQVRYPSKPSPLLQRLSLSPGLQPSRRCSLRSEELGFTRPQGFLRRRVRCSRGRRIDNGGPMLPWAFLELQLSLCAPDCSGLLPPTEVAGAHRTASSAAPACQPSRGPSLRRPP